MGFRAIVAGSSRLARRVTRAEIADGCGPGCEVFEVLEELVNAWHNVSGVSDIVGCLDLGERLDCDDRTLLRNFPVKPCTADDGTTAIGYGTLRG